MMLGLASSLTVAWLAASGMGGTYAPAPLPTRSPIPKVDVVEQLGEKLPLDLTFTDSNGQPYDIGQAFHHGKPVLLSLVYYRCNMLCNPMLNGLVAGLSKTGLTLGKDYEALTVSFDPHESRELALDRKRGHLEALGRNESDPDWRFLTSTHEPTIRKLADAVGFGYAYDEASKQYAHKAVAFVITPEGTIARYLYGIEFSPRDLRLSLVEASHGRVGTTLDRVMLTCFQYDPASRKYTPYVLAFVRISALTVLAALAALLTILWRHDLKMKKQRGASTT